MIVVIANKQVAEFSRILKFTQVLRGKKKTEEREEQFE